MQYAVIRLEGSYQETGSRFNLMKTFSDERVFRLDHLLEQVEAILRTASISRVAVVRGFDFHTPLFGAVEEIRSALARLAEAGKEVWYCASDYEMADCCLASACTRRLMHPLGTLAFRGTARTGLFFKEALDRHHVEVAVIRRGTFKSAANAFQHTAFDEADRLQWERLLESMVEFCRSAVARSGMMDEAMLDALIGGTFLSAEEALSRGVIDAVQVPESLIAGWKKEKARLHRKKTMSGGYGRGRRAVAVLFHEGAIVEGRSRTSPLLGESIGDESMIRQIRKLEKRREVKAVVFRINSGGGSAIASENILKALESLASKKPLAVSMGPVAGSGGYWIAGTGRRLFSTATTITGSIGVISLFINLRNVLASQGITADTVRQGEFADSGSTLRAMREDERAAFELMIERIYREFVRRTAAARGISEERAAELAEGRVWIGQDAVERGLADEIGGLQDAVAWIRKEAGIRGTRTVCYPKARSSLIQRLLTSKKDFEPLALLDEAGIAAGGQLPAGRRLSVAESLLAEVRLLAGKPLALFWDWYGGGNHN